MLFPSQVSPSVMNQIASRSLINDDIKGAQSKPRVNTRNIFQNDFVKTSLLHEDDRIQRQQDLGFKLRNPMYANFNYGGNQNYNDQIRDSLDNFQEAFNSNSVSSQNLQLHENRGLAPSVSLQNLQSNENGFGNLVSPKYGSNQNGNNVPNQRYSNHSNETNYYPNPQSSQNSFPSVNDQGYNQSSSINQPVSNTEYGLLQPMSTKHQIIQQENQYFNNNNNYANNVAPSNNYQEKYQQPTSYQNKDYSLNNDFYSGNNNNPSNQREPTIPLVLNSDNMNQNKNFYSPREQNLGLERDYFSSQFTNNNNNNINSLQHKRTYNNGSTHLNVPNHSQRMDELLSTHKLPENQAPTSSQIPIPQLERNDYSSKPNYENTSQQQLPDRPKVQMYSILSAQRQGALV